MEAQRSAGNPPDTVGHPPRTTMSVSHRPSLQATKRRNCPQQKCSEHVAGGGPTVAPPWLKTETRRGA